MFFNAFMKARHQQGQVAPLLIVIIVIMIIAALITANVGKVSLEKLGCMQGADAGALAGVSVICTSYNHASVLNMVMFMTFLFTMVYLIDPRPLWDWLTRQKFVLGVVAFTDTLYYAGQKIVEGSTDVAPKEAYHYAFVNAGIDDPYKYDRDSGAWRKNANGVSWSKWMSMKTAFEKWENELPHHWEKSGSLTYTWHDGSESVTVDVSVSGHPGVEGKWMIPFGLYEIPIVNWLLPLPHLPLLPEQWWIGFELTGSGGDVSVSVSHSVNRENDLGFWQVQSPSTSASASASISGDMGEVNSFNFDLD